MNFKALSNHYMHSVEFRQLELCSQRSYHGWLKQVPLHVTGCTKDFYEWIKQLNVSAASKNHCLAVIRGVYSWGERHGVSNPVENNISAVKNFRSDPRMPVGWTLDEINAVCAQASSPTEEICAAYLKTLFWTGGRANEILRLKWKDIDYDKHLIAIRGAKKREPGVISRYCNLLPVIVDCLQTAYESLDPDARGLDDWVFVNPAHKINRLTDITAIKHIYRMSARVGVHKTLRQARTGLATSMLLNGYSITDVQATLGHKSIETTQRYLRPTLQQSAKVFKGLGASCLQESPGPAAAGLR